MTKICAISDTHGKDMWLDLPKCDILLFCGDFGIFDKSSLSYANYWFGKQDATHKIFVSGNHDRYLEILGKEKCKELFTNVTYLQDEMVAIEGLRIYGSPWTPIFNNWAFMKPRGSKDLQEIWAKIPENLDFLVTHGPPYQILDESYRGENCGCEILHREVFKKKPKHSVFGHIHGSYGNKKVNNIHFYNCSVLDEDYKMTNNPTIIEI